MAGHEVPRTYDIGPGRADLGQALAEAKDGSGYVITGLSAGPVTGLDVLLLKIDCAGEPPAAGDVRAA